MPDGLPLPGLIVQLQGESLVKHAFLEITSIKFVRRRIQRLVNLRIFGAIFLLLWCSDLVVCEAEEPAARADMGQLTLRVLDDQSDQVISARIVLLAADGTYPGDRLAATADRWPNIEAHGVFIADETTLDLPAGRTRITAAHGLEYKTESQTVEIVSGENTTAELRLSRVINMRESGWVAGDLHVHMIHGENQRPTSYEDVAVTCAAGGLDFVSVGQEYVGAGQLDLEGYQEKCRAVSTEQFKMFLGGERPKNILGHQVLLGCENPFLISEEVPYFKSVAAIQAQGGVSIYVHPVRYYPGKHYGGQWLDFPGNNLARELIFDAYTGPSFDGLSVLSDEPANPAAHQLWFNLLNRGCFVPVFADSDACFDRPTLGLKTPGFWNTYYHIGADTRLTQQALCEAVRQGRTFATTGPLIQFRIANQLSGATLPVDGAECEVTIDAWYPQHSFSLESVDKVTGQPVGISKVELLRNGSVVQHWEPNSAEVHLRHKISESEDSWYALRAYGSDQRWQVALASPIYFSGEPVRRKRAPREVPVQGQIYDFVTGNERSGTVTIRRHGEQLQRIDAMGSFQVNMPLDAEITVEAEGEPAITKNLLMDYAPIHRFLWYLESSDMGKPETLDEFEILTRHVELDFPVGFRMAGGYIADRLERPTGFDSVMVLDGPEPVTGGTVAVASILTDVSQIASGEKFHVAVVFRDEGQADQCGPYVVEGRGYDPSRPTAFGALKKFDTIETNWADAEDLGKGYKLLRGELEVPQWVSDGPDGWIDLSIRARRGNEDAVFIGMVLPIGPTVPELTLSNSWPTMPLSWPDRSYGAGPFRICNRIGRKAQPLSDYRQLHLKVLSGAREFDLLPKRDCHGCPKSANAMAAEHYLDQILNLETQLVR
jgi:hypothetical protein